MTASSQTSGFCDQAATPSSTAVTIHACATSQMPRQGEARVIAAHSERSKKRSGGKRRTAGITQHNKLRCETKVLPFWHSFGANERARIRIWKPLSEDRKSTRLNSSH